MGVFPLNLKKLARCGRAVGLIVYRQAPSTNVDRISKRSAQALSVCSILLVTLQRQFGRCQARIAELEKGEMVGSRPPAHINDPFLRWRSEEKGRKNSFPKEP